MYTKCKAIARVVKTHGKLGEVVAVGAYDLSRVINEHVELCIVPPSLNGPRWFEVDSISGNEAGSLIHFKGIDTISSAEEFVGKTILIKEADLPKDFYLYDREHLIGATLEDEILGIIGTIEDMMITPSYDVWVIHSEEGDILIPAIADIVKGFNEKTGNLIVNIPAGISEGIDKMRNQQ